MRELRQHFGLQLRAALREFFKKCSATAAQKESVERPQARGFLHVARHDGGPAAVYVVSYRHVDQSAQDATVPVLVEGAQALIELLERAGVDFRLPETRGALADILRFGSANIPDLWLVAEEVPTAF